MLLCFLNMVANQLEPLRHSFFLKYSLSHVFGLVIGIYHARHAFCINICFGLMAVVYLVCVVEVELHKDWIQAFKWYEQPWLCIMANKVVDLWMHWVWLGRLCISCYFGS